MASRPSKRQKRPVVLSSEEDEELIVLEKHDSRTKKNSTARNKSTQTTSKKNGSTSSLPTRPRSQTRMTNLRSRSSTTIPEGPPLAPKKLARKNSRSENDEKSRSLHAFFNKENPREQSQAKVQDREEIPELNIEVDDIIEDDSQDDGFPKPSSSQNAIGSILDRRKRHLVPTQSRAVSILGDKFPSASQKFIVHETHDKVAFKQTTNSSTQIDQRPWAEKYGPTGVEELAVHKRKLLDVRAWLENVWSGQGQKRLLVLKGPSGAGKTATVFALCNSMGIDISEWKNPAGTDFSSESYISLASQFEEFLGRSGKFSSLEFVSGSLDHSREPSVIELESEFIRKKIILIEEFPNTFTSTSTALKSFRSSITKYLAASRPSMRILSVSSTQTDLPESFSPVVMIMTEANFTSTSASNDTFSAHRLLGPEILNHPLVSVIEFNPIAPTYITKALDLVIKKEARHSGRRRIPGPSVIKNLGETGDIRSAIGSLEFLCLRGEDWDDWGGSVAGRAKKGASSSSALTKMEKETLEMVTQRETSLGIFHAVGKVVYNKREEVEVEIINSNQELPTQLPSHPPHQTKLQISQVSLDQLIDESGTDTSTFIAALHENYVLSCHGTAFTDSLNGCLDALSDSDILSSDRRGRFNSSFVSGGFGRSSYQGDAASDALRQDDICFHVAARGILFALPCPVQRRAASKGIEGPSGGGGGKRDAFKMFYPASLKLSRQMEEVEALVDRWASRYGTGLSPLVATSTTRLFNFSTSSSFAPREEPPSSNRLPSSSTLTGQKAPLIPTPTNILHPPPLPPLPLPTSPLKTDLVLDTLPYVTAIERASISTSSSSALQPFPRTNYLKDLESITCFRGLEASLVGLDVDLEAGDDGDGDGGGDGERGRDREGLVELELELKLDDRLWLSEDDIEDF